MPKVDKKQTPEVKPFVQDKDFDKEGQPTDIKPIGGSRHPGVSDEKAPKSDDFKRRSESAKRAWQVRRESGNRVSS